MSPIAAAGARVHRVRLQDPTNVPDGDGGYTQSWVDRTPAELYASITPAAARDLERLVAGTVLATASHLVIVPYQPGVTTKTRVLFGARTFAIGGVANPEERNIDLVLVCTELVQ